MTIKFLKTKFYPVDQFSEVIYNDPKPRASDVWPNGPYACHVIGVKGVQLEQWTSKETSKLRTFAIMPPPNR